MLLPSHPHFLANGLHYGLDHCTLPAKVIGGVLIMLSCWSWMVMSSKLFFLRRSRRANVEFEELYYGSAHPLGAFQSGEHFPLSPHYHIYYTAARELAFQLVGIDLPDKTFATRLQGAGRITPTQLCAVQRAVQRAVSEAALRFESRLGVVAMALSGAPVIGLLGTIWAVMDTFAALGETHGVASLQVMAPGICAALLTTITGLLVAIPSMFGYNLLVGRIRSMVARMDHFASEVLSSLDRTFVDHRSSSDTLPSLGALGSPNLPAFSIAASSPLAAPVSSTVVTRAPTTSVL